MKAFIKHNWPYFTLYLLVICVSFYFLLHYDKLTIHVGINRLVGDPFVDTFFKYITHAGDGFVAAMIAVIVLLLNAKKGLFLSVTYVVCGLTSSLLKNYVFDENRPHFMFDAYHPEHKITYVEGVDLLAKNSFPSGHATSAFAIFTALALATDNKALKLVFFLLAFLAAFSRTYLSQHWLEDITLGSLIGTVGALLFYFLIMPPNKFQKLDKPLLKVFNP
jgi:membrane-associated phospholipid phosphatase